MCLFRTTKTKSSFTKSNVSSVTNIRSAETRHGRLTRMKALGRSDHFGSVLSLNDDDLDLYGFYTK